MGELVIVNVTTTKIYVSFTDFKVYFTLTVKKLSKLVYQIYFLLIFLFIK